MAETVNRDRFVFRGTLPPDGKLSELEDGVYHSHLASIGERQIWERLYIEGNKITYTHRFEFNPSERDPRS
jgi:hypothetical protein